MRISSRSLPARPTRPPRAAIIASALAIHLLLSPACGDPDDDDPRVAWLAEHAIPISSLEPTDDDFSDLEPLASLIGDARVVMLGEQSHGDGTTFVAKTRLIAFLHQRMGFDVLAFESGIYDMRHAWDLIRSSTPAHQAMRQGVFDIWMGSAEMRPLSDYIDATWSGETPLELAGVDIQFSGPASGTPVVADLQAFLEGVGSPLLLDAGWAGFAAQLERLGNQEWYNDLPEAAELDSFAGFLSALMDELTALAEQRPDDRELAYWRQVLPSIQLTAQRFELAEQGVSPRELGDIRDRAMGENLIWLARERYPERRIIVWAATRHTARNIHLVDGSPYEIDYSDVVTLGQVAHDALGSELYSLAFTAASGSLGIWWRDPEVLPPLPEDSFEDLATRAGLRHAIVDFRDIAAGGEWLREPLVVRLLGHGDMTGRWTEVVDSVFFLETMAPATASE